MKTYSILLSLALLFLTACSQSNYYQLHPISTTVSTNKSQMRKPPVGIAEVEVASYLNKSEIVTRMGAGRLDIHTSDLWAGDLDKNIQTVLKHNLSALLPHYAFYSYPWEEPVEDRYRVYVTIDRFDGYETGQVILQGRWSLVDKEDNRVSYSEAINYTAHGAKNLDAIVDTQSRLLNRLSQRIAGKIRRHL